MKMFLLMFRNRLSMIAEFFPDLPKRPEHYTDPVELYSDIKFVCTTNTLINIRGAVEEHFSGNKSKKYYGRRKTEARERAKKQWPSELYKCKVPGESTIVVVARNAKEATRRINAVRSIRLNNFYPVSLQDVSKFI